jgi:hypothetical protein
MTPPPSPRALSSLELLPPLPTSAARIPHTVLQTDPIGLHHRRDGEEQRRGMVLTVYFGAPSMFITLWFGFDYGTNPPLGTLII